MTGRLDDQQQRFAAQLEADHQGWVVMWGYHSRLYWAFPRFDAPQGTIVAAPVPAELTEGMRRAEFAAAQTPRLGPAPAAARPRRGGPVPRQPAADTAIAGQERPAEGGLQEPEASVG